VGGLFSARQVIRSPEQVALDLDIAGPMSRVLAFSLDYGLILIAELLLLLVLLFGFAATADLERLAAWLESAVEGVEEGGAGPSPGTLLLLVAVWIVVEFTLQWGYFVVCEVLMQGRSPGKAALGLRVVRDGGLPVGLRDSMVRNLMRMADMLPPGSYLVGLLSMVISSEHKRLGDYAAGTLVVREGKSESAAPIALDAAQEAGGGTEFRFERSQLEAVGGHERRLIRQTLRRLDQLSARRRDQVLERAVGALRRRIGLEEEIPARDRRAFLLALLRDVENL
jgi:uncharacterized RDD family membrane protein YckC